MLSTLKPLFQLTAEDLMTAMVVTIPQDMSLRGAARRLMEYQVMGGPVVDEDSRCVGVVSASDFLRWASKDPGRHGPSDCYCSSWQIVQPDDMPHDQTVRMYMTADAVTVTRGTPIHKLAQMMLDAHIHRLIVVDRERRPIGVVSSTDILAALTRAGNLEHDVDESAHFAERF